MRRKKFVSRNDWYSILSPEFLFIGQGLHFWYPVRNRFGVPVEFAHRAISITAIDYFRGSGIPAEWIKRNPLVRRGSWLITGIDVDLHAEKSFYWEAMHHRRVRDAGMNPLRPTVHPQPRRPFPLPHLRLGFHAPGEFIDWVSEPCPPNKQARLSLRDAVMRIEESTFDSFGDLQLSAFPVRR